MARIDVVLPDELETEFRAEIFRRFGGFKRGYLKAAIEEAIDGWIRKKK